ncbi:MAG TPA: glycosyltransferase, partial [Cellulomonadaceae bacterium]|nr:glycosyltransferase [Cellulomonadaceae bacterium]
MIPTRNRRESLLRAIESLSLQTADGGTFDVLVVADGCTDGTSFVVEQRARTAAWADRGLVCVEQ